MVKIEDISVDDINKIKDPVEKLKNFKRYFILFAMKNKRTKYYLESSGVTNPDKYDIVPENTVIIPKDFGIDKSPNGFIEMRYDEIVYFFDLLEIHLKTNIVNKNLLKDLAKVKLGGRNND